MENSKIEESLSKIIDYADVIMLYMDKYGKVALCNKKIAEFTRKTKEEIIGQDWFNILYQEKSKVMKHQTFKAVIDDSVNFKRANNFEDVIFDANNSEHVVSWNITPIVTEKEECEGILLLGNDITILKERVAPFKKIDETLKNIFTSLKEYALYVTNLDGNITYYGMGAEIMFGWKKDEIIFKHVSLLHVPGDGEHRLPFILEQVKRSGKHELEIELTKKDGQHFPVFLIISQFLDIDGRLIGYIFIAKDITERKKLEYQIFQAEKLAAIGQMAAGMAHGINNPLFVIAGRLGMLLEEKKLPRSIRGSLNIMNTQVDRIRNLVNRMLKFSRKATLKEEPVKINEVIGSVLPLLSYHSLPLSHTEIAKDLAEGLPPIKGDINQLQEVFINLFLNAYQSMPEGGRLNIKTSNFQNLYAEIRISDTGVGIPEQNLKNIFMPFFSTKKDGTGLGLSICYNIIKNHNGSIEVESRVNQGTTFIIKLPFV